MTVCDFDTGYGFHFSNILYVFWKAPTNNPVLLKKALDSH